MRNNPFASPTSDEIDADPASVGMPTFDEFKKNPDIIRGKQDEVFASAEKGGEIANAFTKKHIYEIAGYRVKSLAEVEKIATDRGIPLRELDYRAVCIPCGAGKADVLVKFMSKQEIARRNAKHVRKMD